MTHSGITGLLRQVEELRAAVVEDGCDIAQKWDGYVERPDFAPSAENFSHYLALRRRDIRSLQRDLMVHGLSSLGRAEGPPPRDGFMPLGADPLCVEKLEAIERWILAGAPP